MNFRHCFNDGKTSWFHNYLFSFHNLADNSDSAITIDKAGGPAFNSNEKWNSTSESGAVPFIGNIVVFGVDRTIGDTVRMKMTFGYRVKDLLQGQLHNVNQSLKPIKRYYFVLWWLTILAETIFLAAKNWKDLIKPNQIKELIKDWSWVALLDFMMCQIQLCLLWRMSILCAEDMQWYQRHSRNSRKNLIL